MSSWCERGDIFMHFISVSILINIVLNHHRTVDAADIHCKAWKRFTTDGIDILHDRIIIVQAIKIIEDIGKSFTYFKMQSRDISKLENDPFTDFPRLKKLYLE